MRAAAARDIDEYLGGAPDDARVALEKLRKTIKSAAPGAAESISYQIPTFKLNGKPLVYFAAFKDHCSLYPATEAVMDACKEELKPYYSGKGTLRFEARRPIPPALVKKIVKVRIAEIDAAAANKKRATSSSGRKQARG